MFQIRHLFCTPSETKLLLQHSVIAAASQQISPSTQWCSPIKEKQTGHFHLVNLTCKQHEGTKSPASPPVSRGLVCVSCLCVILYARGKKVFANILYIGKMCWNGRILAL